jgi:hypothetical protein
MAVVFEEEAGQLILRSSGGYIRLSGSEQLEVKDFLQNNWPDQYEEESQPTKEPENAKLFPHYFKELPEGITHIDVYLLLDLWNVTSQGIGHAIKKLLAPGIRHSKSYLQDLTEARNTLNRVIEIETLKRKGAEDE